jgi:hypothetical protein
MSKSYLASLSKSDVRLENSKTRLPYRQPQLYFLGSLEKVQSDSQGNLYDGPDALCYYYG